MREILFRGKRVDNGEWVEGGFVPSSDGKRFYIGNMFECVEIVPKTRSEYTACTDKNGTRIFEGDIIKQVIPHNLVQPFIFTVNWCEECAMFVLSCITNDAFESDFTVMRSDEIEVIGNIHDNGHPF